MGADRGYWRRGGVGSYCAALFPLACLLTRQSNVTDPATIASETLAVAAYWVQIVTSLAVIIWQARRVQKTNAEKKPDAGGDGKTETASAPRSPMREPGEPLWLGLFLALALYHSLRTLHWVTPSSILTVPAILLLLYRMTVVVVTQTAIPRLMPRCFTPGEAAVCAQLAEQAAYTCARTLAGSGAGLCYAYTPPTAAVLATDTHVTYFILVSVSSCLAVVATANLVPLFRRGAAFYVLVVMVMGGVSYPVLNCLLRQDYVSWLYMYIRAEGTRVRLFCYWCTCFLAAGGSVCVADPGVQGALCGWLPAVVVPASWRRPPSSARLSHVALVTVRKQFHALAVAVFLPGVLYDVQITCVAIACAFQIFLMVESLRVFRVPPLGAPLNANLAAFTDDKDEGSLLLTPVYLLVGCGLPLALLPYSTAHLPLLSGVVAVGVGDSAASVVGTRYGRRRWPGTGKTVEGTVSAVLAELAFVGLVCWAWPGRLEVHLPSLLLAATGSSLLEAYTTQIDNIILPLAFFIFLNIQIIG